jgi:hypothetical protein
MNMDGLPLGKGVIFTGERNHREYIFLGERDHCENIFVGERAQHESLLKKEKLAQAPARRARNSSERLYPTLSSPSLAAPR